MGSNKLTNLADGVSSSDAVNKGQLDAAVNGLSWKSPVRVATSTNTTLSTPGANVDGVAMSSGDRVLLTGQTAPAENGIWEWNGAASAMTRPADFDGAGEADSAACFIAEGTSADEAYTQTTESVTIDTTSQTWVQFTGAGSITAGTGMSKTGSTLNVGDAGKGVQANADDLEIDASEIAATSGGLKQNATNSWQLEVEPADFAGEGLVDDGSDNMAIDWSTLFNDAKAVKASDLNSTATGKGASIIGIEDSGALITATDVEGALAENRTAIDALEDNTITGGNGITSTGTVGADDQAISVDLKTSGGLKIDTGQIAAEPADFAGSGLEDDGSDNLQINVDSTNSTTKINGSSELESLKQIVEVLTLSAGDITAEAVTLSQTPNGNQVSVSVDGIVQEEGVDYSISGTSLRFGDAADAGLTSSDLDPTSGSAALIAGDKIQVSYMYL